jgi:hypothetical protein
MGSYLEQTLEIEANVYALLSLFPTGVLKAIEARTELNAETLRDVATDLYDTPVDEAMVRERLLIHGVLMPPVQQEAEERLRQEFHDLFVGRPSWSVLGAPAMKDRCASGLPGRPAVLTQRHIEEIREALRKSGILPPEDRFDWSGGGGFGIARVNETF